MITWRGQDSFQMNRQIITVTGKTGRGKTFLIERYVIPKMAEKVPVVIADSMNEYKHSGPTYSADAFLNVIYSGDLDSRPYRIAIQSDVEARKIFAFSKLSKIKHCLVVEEASKYCNPWQIDPYLRDVVRYGRHWGVSAIFISQRFAQLNKIITSQSDYFVSFAQTEANDLKSIKNYTDKYKRVKGLNKREFLLFGDIPEKGAIFNQSKINKILRLHVNGNKPQLKTVQKNE
jgi:hypothetical protein